MGALAAAQTPSRVDLLRIHIVQPGTYAVTGGDLARFRADWQSLDPARLSLKYDGRPWPMLLEGLRADGRLTSETRLIFYAPVTPPAPYTNVFADGAPLPNFMQLFLEAEPSEALRFADRSIDGETGPAQPDAAAAPARLKITTETLRFEPNLIWEFFQPATEGQRLAPTDFRFWAKLARPATTENESAYGFAFILKDADRDRRRAATIRAHLYGVSDLASPRDHSARLLLNGREVARAAWDGLAPATLEGAVPARALIEGQNVIDVELLAPDGATTPPAAFDVILLDGVEVIYPRRPRAQKDYVVFPWPQSAPARFVIEGFRSRHLTALDIDHARRLPVEVGRRGLLRATRTASIRVDGPTSTVVVFAETTPLGRPARLEPVRLLGLRAARAAADYLVIAPSELIPPLIPLIEHRRAEGLRAAVVPAEAIYQEFGGGFPRPQAIKDFVAFARAHWGRPRYLLLVGDACAVNALKSLLPAYSFGSGAGSHASDQWFAMLEGGDSIPDMAVGRISAATPEQVAGIVAKTLARERGIAGGPWRAESLFIAASTDWAERASRLIMRKQLAPWLGARLLKTDQQATRIEDHQQLTRQIAAALDEGRFLTVFFGHGGGTNWEVGPSIRQEFFRAHLFDRSNVERLTNFERQTLVLALTCFTNDFDHPHFPETIGESFLRARGGAWAVLGTSGRTDDNSSVRFARDFSRSILEGRAGRVGDAALAALQAVNNDEMNHHLVLLGDPAARIQLPERTAALDPADPAPLTLRLSASADGGPDGRVAGRLPGASYSGPARLRIEDALGAPVYSAEVAVREGVFDVPLPVLKAASGPLYWPLSVRVYVFDPATRRDWLGAVFVNPPPASQGQPRQLAP